MCVVLGLCWNGSRGAKAQSARGFIFPSCVHLRSVLICMHNIIIGMD